MAIAIPSILALTLYQRGQRRKVLNFDYSIYQFVSLENPVGALEMTYAQEKITSLNLIRVAVYNGGNVEIRRGDVPPISPLVFKVNQGNILEVRVVKEIEPTNKFEARLSEDKKSVDLSFDYLNADQGAIMLAYHTGKGDGLEVSMEGKIIGGGVPILTNIATKSVKPLLAVVTVVYGLTVALVFLLYANFYSIYPWLPFIAALEFGVILVLLLLGRIPNQIRAKKGFEEFISEGF